MTDTGTEQVKLRQRATQILAEFFIEEFANDPKGVGEWVTAGGDDFDAIYPIIRELAKSRK